ncbi:hypothetical protein [Modestobacter sp. NPDC049651]|uniref:hypothetical protein n=1 Tax=unclassified Modestobacter TaxID=2643866 RepID=UPI00340BF561
MTAPMPDWVEQGRRLVVGLLDGVGTAHHHASDDPAARSCPLCAAQATWRERGPALLEGLADVLSSTAEVLRASASRTTPDGSAADPDPTPDTSVPAEETVSQQAPAPSPVQRIDVA